MTSRRQIRVRVDPEGRLEVVDPGFDSLDLLRRIDPSFQIRKGRLPGFVRPKVLRTRARGSGLALNELAGLPEQDLWLAHRRGVTMATSERAVTRRAAGEASLLDLKIELARRMLRACRLCGRRCGVDRLAGQRGPCGLGPDAFLAECFTHIAEEPPINPSLLLSLAGCGLKCRHCQQYPLREPEPLDIEVLSKDIWHRLDLGQARSISFAGGNPDESLPGILRFLSWAPDGLRIPIVWNCHGYASAETIDLLEGVVDAYLPDFKYGSNACGLRLSQVADYPMVAAEAFRRMVNQGVPVIARILVLPGHLDCCHRPALETLASLGAANLRVSVRGQYCPDGDIGPADGEMARRPWPNEVEAVQAFAKSLGLELIEEV